jgi:hypothetical protein
MLVVSGVLLLPSSVHLRASVDALESIQSRKDKGVDSDYNFPIHLADLENQSIKESSGIAASKRNANLFWTHNDSGDEPFIYAFDRKGKHRGVWRVTGASARDWEDIAVGPGPERNRSYIYLGDIGDNSGNRDEIVVYRIPEPLVTSADSSSSNQNPGTTEPSNAIRLKFPDGKHDAETLLVHPTTGDLYVVTKVLRHSAAVYKLNAPLPESGIATLTRVREVRLSNIAIGFITGGDISPDGHRVILCDYLGAFELVLPKKSGISFDEIWKQPMNAVNLGTLATRRQGEAVCYRRDGLALLATSEKLPCPLIEVTRRVRKP